MVALRQPALPATGRRARSAARGVVQTLLGASAGAVANIVVLALAVRELGPGPVGQYALALGAAGVVGVLEGALTTMTAQRVAGRRGDIAHQHAPGAAARFVGVLLLVLTSCAVGGLLAYGARPATALGLVGGVGAATALLLGTAGSVGRAQAADRFGVLGCATAAGAVARVSAVVVLLPHWGVGALGVGALASALVSRMPVVAVTSGAGTSARRGSVRATLGQSRSLLALGVSGQLLALSDLVVIGALRGAAATGLYRLGAAVPMAAGGLLLRAFEAVLPRLAAYEEAEQQRLVQRMGPALAATAGLGFGALAGVAEPVARLLLGQDSAVAAVVVVVLSAVYVLDSAVHLPVLLAVARGDQARLARLVPAELTINLVSTVGLVLLVGPVGAAVGTLLTTAVLDLVLFPLSPARGGTPVRTLWTHGFLPAGGAMLLGAAIGLTVAGSGTGDVTAVMGAAGIVTVLWLGAAASLVVRRGRRPS